MHELQTSANRERAAALDILLLLADVRADWHEFDRALDLLERVEDVLGRLPLDYELRRRHWTILAARGCAR